MRFRTRWLTPAMLVLLLTLSGCQRDGETASSAQTAGPQPLDSLSDHQAQQKQFALAARDKLFSSLLEELMASMSENGPVRSIKVCKTRAPEVSLGVGQDSGVRIGRTSFQLRNPDNQPPDWAASFVADQVDREINVELPDEALGVLLPIHLKSTCVVCHGPDQQLMPDLKAAIVSSYPDDEATGFVEGDLRGYFWVEVPRQEKATK